MYLVAGSLCNIQARGTVRDTRIVLWHTGTWVKERTIQWSTRIKFSDTSSHNTLGVTSITFSSNNKQIVGTGVGNENSNKEVRIFDVNSGENIKSHRSNYSLLSAKFSPDGHLLATGGDSKAIELIDLTAGKKIAELTGHSSWITDLTYSPDAKYLLSTSADGTARLWNLPATTLRLTLSGRIQSKASLALTPTGFIVGGGRRSSPVLEFHHR
jgi:WD40 repeat protein